MNNENQALQIVYSQVAEKVNELYERYRLRCGLEEEKDTERQLEVLVAKKYISNSFIEDISLIANYYSRGMYAFYFSNLTNYIVRIQVLLESIPAV